MVAGRRVVRFPAPAGAGDSLYPARRYGAYLMVAQPAAGIANCSFLPPMETT